MDGAILTGINWSTPNPCLQVDGAFCSYTAAAQDVLTIRLAATKGTGRGGGHLQLAEHHRSPSQWHSLGIDALQANLSGNGGGSSIQVDVALSWNGVDQASEWETVTLPASTGVVSYPTALSGLLAAWQGTNYPLVPGTMFQLTQLPLQVNTSGAVVTSTSGYFPLDPRLLKAGSRITIAGTEYTIASVDSALQVTLTGSAGTQTGASAYISNFSVMVRKHAATAGTINLDGVTVTMAVGGTFSNSASGFITLCSPVSATDRGGHTGRFCIFPSLNSAIYWITDDLQSRFVGRALLPASSLGVPQDEYNASFYGGQSLFDSTDPNSWYLSASLVSNGRPTLIKATYHPTGVAGCAMPSDFSAFPRPSDWNNGSDNCNITYTEITKPSQGRDIYSQLNPALKTGKFGMPGLSFIQNGVGVFLMNGGSQDTEAWVIHVRLSDGIVTRAVLHLHERGGRLVPVCVLHGPEPSNATDGYYYLIFNSYPGGGTTSGAGPVLPHREYGVEQRTTPAKHCAPPTSPTRQ